MRIIVKEESSHITCKPHLAILHQLLLHIEGGHAGLDRLLNVNHLNGILEDRDGLRLASVDSDLHALDSV
jgi:hypothetical protein